MTIAVVGSINMDVVALTDHYPRRGDTMFGSELRFSPGGKGANQATACAKLGKEALIIGCVGDDLFGDRLIETLGSNHVNVSFIKRSVSRHTGAVLVTIDQSAENTMLVVKGANEELNIVDIDCCSELISKSKVLLVQLEVPQETAIHAMIKAREYGVTVILDPAPAQGITVENLKYADILIPNRQEAQSLTGIHVTDSLSALAAARFLDKRAGVARSIIKMAELGSLVYSYGEWEYIEAIKVKPLDTVAAGDSFAGALACAIADGESLISAAHFATIVSALKVTRQDAQDGIPTLAEVNEFCASRNIKHYLSD
ncbi:ribokinase [Paenibacillus sp. UNC451MF]|uniref:ribokinase n=1 Tax=Paenibacillus sp. UNC451MF TaxID=1449063 RepID=UPI00048EE960|nr:ribokinase [Paenibacillus sp. UNC451MF]